MNYMDTLKTYAGILLLTIFALAIIKTLNISYPVDITTRPSSGELAVVGEGKVDVIPDSASVEAGIVVNDAASVEQAQRRINETNNKIVDAMKNLGIRKEDIKTSNYSINPNYDYSTGGRGTINGYNGNVNLSIKVKATEKLDDVVAAATAAGANNIYGTNFTVEEPQKYREQARDKAIANARQQAEKLAQSLGIRLGRIVNVVESSPTTPPVILERSLAVDGAGGGKADFEPGSQTIISTVTLYFEKR